MARKSPASSAQNHMSNGWASVIEVGPRDGLQNESTTIELSSKLAFIQNLVDSGLQEIEATSFVSPKYIPQLADADALWPRLPHGAQFSALVANQRGLDRALAVGVKHIAVFTAASSTFTEKNIGMSREQSLLVFEDLIGRFRGEGGMKVRGYVSTIVECPYAGMIAADEVLKVTDSLFKMGVDEVSLGDTIGTGSPVEIERLMKQISASFDVKRIACHFHDTFGMAIANVEASLPFGIRRFDSSAAGLGGCPYAPGAGGNLATDDLAYFLERSGFETGINRVALAQASVPILNELGRNPSAKAQQATLAKVSRIQNRE